MTKPNHAFQLKITLNDSSPKIWRRIVVPRTYSFFDLHIAIQSAIGWSDSHLHGFYIAQKGTAIPIVIEFPHPDIDDDADRKLDERKEKIADYFGKYIQQCQYEYDFGDGWQHTVLLEKEIPFESGTTYPKLLAGKNACPPEDCGGVWGYKDLQEILKNQKHPEHNEMLGWLALEDASDFDPTEFDPSEMEFNDPRQRLKEYEQNM